MSRKIYIVGGSPHYANWMKGEIVDKLEDANLVVFTGGEDVSPILYNEPAHPKTYCNQHRDLREMRVFENAVALGKHIIGICRGSQLSCVMSGGRLIQDQSNSSYMHATKTLYGEQIYITSTHHQAMYPYDMKPEDYKILAWTNNQSKFHKDGMDKEISDVPFDEVEICYFPKTKALGIQGHPESMDAKAYPNTFSYLHKLLDNHLENKLI